MHWIECWNGYCVDLPSLLYFTFYFYHTLDYLFPLVPKLHLSNGVDSFHWAYALIRFVMIFYCLLLLR
jgi:hypothetical protein